MPVKIPMKLAPIKITIGEGLLDFQLNDVFTEWAVT